jgi:FkbM family methyltransferase
MAAEHDIDVVVRDHFFPRPAQKILGIFPRRNSKVIIEVGAARPDYLSIGASFRKLGWKVISIEPNPKFCAAHRALGFDVLEYACGDEDRDNVDFYVVDSWGAEYMSGAVSNESFSSLGIAGEYAKLHESLAGKRTTETIKVKLRKLDTILARHEPKLKEIDILAVDVEDWELSVLRGFSIGRYRPKVVILENLFEDPKYGSEMRDLGYALWRSMPPNEIYYRD